METVVKIEIDYAEPVEIHFVERELPIKQIVVCYASYRLHCHPMLE